MNEAAHRFVPAGVDVRRVVTGAGPLRVLHAAARSGRKSPVVLIHGGGSDNAAISWGRLIHPLAADRDVWAPDLPGFGGSIDIPPVGSPRAMADLVADCMDKLATGPAIVFGVSMGGDVALNLALAHPRQVSGLVLVAPGGLVAILRNRPTQFMAWLAAQAPDWLLVPAARLANRFVKTALRAMVKNPATIPPDVMEEFAREARHPRGGIGYGRYNQATLGQRGMLNDLSGRVAEIDIPTLIVHGQDDPIVDPEGSRRAAAKMPDARLVMIPDCGHWAQIEEHERFLDEVKVFLGKFDG